MEGAYEERDVSEDMLWEAIACVFTENSKKNSSYKFGFLRSILDNLDNVDDDLKLTFDQLFTRFTEIYWDLVLKYNLRQKTVSKRSSRPSIEIILLEAKEKYLASERIIPFNDLPRNAREDVAHQVKMKCKTYVVGALFEDTKRLFYSFSKKEEWIQINPRMYEFVCARKKEIERLNNYEWAYFLEGANEGYKANDILSNCLLKAGNVSTNKFEVLIDIEEVNSTSKPYSEPLSRPLSVADKSTYEMDDEIEQLLDDPIGLIKLLKKRRGIRV